METNQKAKRIRRKATGKKRNVEVVEPDQIDEYDESAVKAMVANTPEVRFRHSSYFTDDEDKIIAASIKSRIQLYKVAASLKCCFNTLKKHIENTPVLSEIAREAREIECGELREAVDDLVKMRHPQVVMWRAKQLMPNEYGDAVETEEDDTRIVIGAIPDELIAEADERLKQAAEKPPEVGLAAMMAVRENEEEEKKEDGGKKEDRKAKEDKQEEEDTASAQEQEDGEEEGDGGDFDFGGEDFMEGSSDIF